MSDMDVNRYLTVTGETAHSLAQRSRCSYPVVLAAKAGKATGLDVARKLEQATDGLIRAAHVLQLDGSETPAAVDLIRRHESQAQA